MPTPEGRTKKRIREYLDSYGSTVWHAVLSAGPFSQRGLPDLCVIVNGNALFIEVKAPGKRATALQRHTLMQISLAGANVAVVETLEEVVDLVEKML